MDEFAVEWDADEGSFCYWIQGRKIDDPPEMSYWCSILAQLWDMQWATGKRCNSSLFEFPAQKLLLTLDGAMFYRPNFESQEEFEHWQRLSYDEQWARHNISPFDSWKIYYIENQEVARVITARISTGLVVPAQLRPVVATQRTTEVSPYLDIRETTLPPGVVDLVLTEAVRLLDLERAR